MSDVMIDYEKASNPAQRTVHHVSTRTSNIGNPGTLGLFCFASTTLMLSLYNLQVRSITHANVVVGMAIFCGGLAQLLAGMWEFARGNTFGATAFTSYGAFWMSYATILIPGSGIVAAYANGGPHELSGALGIFLITWFIVTFFFFVASLRKHIAFISLFGMLSITFILLAVGEFNGLAKATQAGGGLGVVTALIAYYIGLSELLASDPHSIVQLPLGVFNHGN